MKAGGLAEAQDVSFLDNQPQFSDLNQIDLDINFTWFQVYFIFVEKIL